MIYAGLILIEPVEVEVLAGLIFIEPVVVEILAGLILIEPVEVEVVVSIFEGAAAFWHPAKIINVARMAASVSFCFI